MNIEKIIDSPAASLNELEAAQQQIAAQRSQLEQQQADAQAKADASAVAIARRGGSAEEARELVIEQQSIALLLGGVISLESQVGLRIAAEQQRLSAQELTERWAEVAAELDLRNADIDAAEAALSLAATHIQAALAHTSRAALLAPQQQLGTHRLSEILEGMDLIPAMTERFWLAMGFKHPAIPSMDNLYARRLGKISEIFEPFECQAIHPGVSS